MTRFSLRAMLIFASLIILSVSCEKDNPLPAESRVSEAEPEPTPYTLEIPTGFPNFLPANDNPLTLEGIELGRKLFHDPILSKDNSQSCASCHEQNNSFTDSRRFSIGVEGLPGTRNSMALVNLAWRRNFFWDGRAASLEEQAFDPIRDPLEMNTTWPEVEEKLNDDSEYRDLFRLAFGIDRIDSNHVVKAIAQFERTLISANTKFDKHLQGQNVLSDLEREGFELFQSEEGDCFHCHNGVFMSDNTFRNNGLQFPIEDEGLGGVTGRDRDNGKFIVPTLRNIEFTGPYMHDGRFQTLREVIDFYNDGVQRNSPNVDPVMLKANRPGGSLGLTEHQKDALIAFLKTLSDESYLSDPRFSDPH